MRATLPKEMSQVETTGDTALAVGDRLPALTLEMVDGQQPINLRRVRHDSSVLILPHADCEGCVAYLRSLEALQAELVAWGGRSLVVAPDEGRARALAAQLACWVLLDPDGRARREAGIDGDAAAVLVTDRFGTVYLSQVSGDDHDLPAPQSLLEEVRHIVTQCPECGVPDDPLSGEERWGR